MDPHRRNLREGHKQKKENIYFFSFRINRFAIERKRTIIRLIKNSNYVKFLKNLEEYVKICFKKNLNINFKRLSSNCSILLAYYGLIPSQHHRFCGADNGKY